MIRFAARAAPVGTGLESRQGSNMKTAAIVTLCILLAACASQQSAVTDRPVSHAPQDELLSAGYALPSSGYLSTSQPNAAVLDRIAGAGYETVVDFRGADEDRGLDEKAEVEARGMRYVSLPIPTTAEATFENAQRLREILATTEGPVLMHCFSGNRAGSMLALAAKLEGASSDEALALGRRGGLTRWEKEIEQILKDDQP